MKKITIILLLSLCGCGVHAQSFVSRHQFDNNGYNVGESVVKIRIGYGKTNSDCDTLFIGKEIHYGLIGAYRGWKGQKRPKDAWMGDDSSDFNETNPKLGRILTGNKERHLWSIYHNDGYIPKHINYVIYHNYDTGQYKAYMK